MVGAGGGNVWTNVAAGCVLLLVLFIVLLYFPIRLVWFLYFFVERKGRIFVGVVAMDALRGRGRPRSRGWSCKRLEVGECVYFILFFCHFFLVFF